jgi:hypothetical protein
MVLVLMVLLSVLWLAVTAGPLGVPSRKPARRQGGYRPRGLIQAPSAIQSAGLTPSPHIA